MKSIFVKIFIVIIIFVFILAFSSSYSSLNLDNSAFVVAIGIDKSDTEKLKVTYQFVNIPSSSEGSTSDAKIILDTIDCSSLSNSVNIMNAYLGKRLNLSHCKLIVFSEEFAKDGISDEIYSLLNDIQIRPTANIVVSKCDSKYYIENSKPSLENLVTKYYNIFPSSSEYTGYLYNATIGDFFNALKCNTCQPYTILGGLTSSASNDNDTSSYSTKDSTIKSNNSPISGNRITENIGLAVFKEDKLAGELTAMETMCFSILRKDSQSFLISVDNPEKENSTIDVYLNLSKKDVDINIINGSPYIKINAKFDGKIYSMSENSKYLNTDVLNFISSECSNYLESNLSSFLYKTSTEFNSDICGIGKYSLSKFLTIKDFNNYNWSNNYKSSVFDIDINTNIDSSFILDQT